MALNLRTITRNFSAPITVAGVTNKTKIFLEGTIDQVPFELSVLPGLHRETFDLAKNDVEKVLPFLRHASGELKLEKEFFGLINHPTLVPSAMFALEAWLFKRAKCEQQAPWNLPVSHNALLLTPSLSRLEVARAEGKTSFKVKIARGESANDILRLLQVLKPNESLRLDGNRQLTPQALTEYLLPLKDYWQHIEYIEEPFANYGDHLSWQHEIALALDESLPQFLSETTHAIKYVVLKPALFGFSKSISIIKSMHQAGVTTTLSSSFEAEIGIGAIMTLSSLQNSLKPNPAGLDTLSFFS